MRKRTPSEIKAYGDGYAEAYKEFCHLLDKHDKDKAIRKMKIFADAVALTVEAVTDTADTPQTERIKTPDYCDICNHKGCDNCTANSLDDYCVPSGYVPKDTTQTDCDKCIWSVCNYNKVDWDADTPQMETKTETENLNLAFELVNDSQGLVNEQTDCAWK